MDTATRRRETQEGSWEWLAFAAGLPAKAILIPGISADTQLFTGRCIYMGFTVANNAAGGGNFNLYDGRDANGYPLNLDFPGNGTTINRFAGMHGVLCENGIFCHVSTGPMNGSLFVIPLWHAPNTAPGE